MRVRGLNSLVDYFNVRTHDIWEGNVTTRREILPKNICSSWFQDIREGVTARRGDITEVKVYLFALHVGRDLGVVFVMSQSLTSNIVKHIWC